MSTVKQSGALARFRWGSYHKKYRRQGKRTKNRLFRWHSAHSAGASATHSFEVRRSTGAALTAPWWCTGRAARWARRRPAQSGASRRRQTTEAQVAPSEPRGTTVTPGRRVTGLRLKTTRVTKRTSGHISRRNVPGKPGSLDPWVKWFSGLLWWPLCLLKPRPQQV